MPIPTPPPSELEVMCCSTGAALLEVQDAAVWGEGVSDDRPGLRRYNKV